MSRIQLTELIAFYQKQPLDLEAQHFTEARRLRDEHYGRKVFLRGLVEFTSYCACNCLYCGLRRSNTAAGRYRLSPKEILDCCRIGYDLGFRSFVLQGGEDGYFSDDVLCRVTSDIKENFPDCALTLSVGERSRSSYAALRRAGVDRYLLRHETADEGHFGRLHPPAQTFESRKKCLVTLKELGFQVGAGFMVGSPGQTPEMLSADLVFLQQLEPHMVGIGPFLPHHATPFAKEAPGKVMDTLLMVALTRLMLPKALLPATTALASLHPQGRIMGMNAGANVVMPNLSPPKVREDYAIYDNKRRTGTEAAEGLALLVHELEGGGYAPVLSRGDHADV